MSASTKLNAFPVFMRVEDRRVVIVGGGDEALAKARLLGQSSARLTIIAEAPDKALSDWVSANGASLVATPYAPELIDGAVLVFAATGEEALDKRISDDARAKGVPVNAVDRPECCDFFTRPSSTARRLLWRSAPRVPARCWRK